MLFIAVMAGRASPQWDEWWRYPHGDVEIIGRLPARLRAYASVICPRSTWWKIARRHRVLGNCGPVAECLSRPRSVARRSQHATVVGEWLAERLRDAEISFT